MNFLIAIALGLCPLRQAQAKFVGWVECNETQQYKNLTYAIQKIFH